MDASSFIFWVGDRISQRLHSGHGAASWSSLLLNGLLVQFSEALCRREVEAVLDQVRAKGIRLVFVFDVNVDVHDDGLKSDTHDARSAQRQQVRLRSASKRFMTPRVQPAGPCMLGNMCRSTGSMCTR